jgi:long-chain acyl-CoA synthetase
MDGVQAGDAYIAYLPLAHIFELTMEILVLLMGVKVGYSGPNTLTDSSTGIKTGHVGDATLLRPTVLTAVPVILDRIFKGINSKIEARGPAFTAFFQMCYNYRLFWTRNGFNTPIMNKLIFSKFRSALGGRLRTIVGGGAPLAAEVHEFLRTTLGVCLAQGYGLTETAGGVTLADRDDTALGRCGFPLPGVRIRLEDWQEGQYTVRDSQGPRGELIVGCPWTASGYFQRPEATKESFFEEDGLRWFKTGDIGQMMPDGTFKIIDRKKDLVKLQMGEYVSLGKVESRLKAHPIVDNVCVYADPTKNSTVALIVPDDPLLHEAATRVLGTSTKSREELCSNPEIVNFIQQSLKTHLRGLEAFEVPKKLALIPEQWLPDTGLVTAALKLRRKIIQDHYQDAIDQLYASIDEPMSSGI